MSNEVFGNFKSMIEHFISVTDLNKKTSLIINEIVQKGKSYIVVKNNIPEVVIIPIGEYIELVEAKEKLLKIEKEKE